MRRILFALCLLSLPLQAQERVTLTAPITKPSITAYELSSVKLDWTAQRVDVRLLSPATGEAQTFSYTDAKATQMMAALNKANLSTRSLKQRIFDRLIADGFLAGTVTGAVP